jgi:disulfide bond formation protein DsbB
MTPLFLPLRLSFLIGFLICSALIAFALYAQYVWMMDPCPLCILQRVVFIALGVVFLIGAIHGPRSNLRYVYAGLAICAALIGIGIASRHLWIQSLPPDQVPSCGAPLGFLLETRAGHGGLIGVLIKVLSGSGECAKIQPILGLPMPLWSLVWFALLGIWAMLAVSRQKSAQHA